MRSAHKPLKLSDLLLNAGGAIQKKKRYGEISNAFVGIWSTFGQYVFMIADVFFITRVCFSSICISEQTSLLATRVMISKERPHYSLSHFIVQFSCYRISNDSPTQLTRLFIGRYTVESTTLRITFKWFSIGKLIVWRDSIISTKRKDLYVGDANVTQFVALITTCASKITVVLIPRTILFQHLFSLIV